MFKVVEARTKDQNGFAIEHSLTRTYFTYLYPSEAIAEIVMRKLENSTLSREVMLYFNFRAYHPISVASMSAVRYLQAGIGAVIKNSTGE